MVLKVVVSWPGNTFIDECQVEHTNIKLVEFYKNTLFAESDDPLELPIDIDIEDYETVTILDD